MKKLSKTQWRKFEEIVFEVIKDILQSSSVSPLSKLTQASADGGYDGLFLIPYMDAVHITDAQAYYKILFEAKLRSTHDADLPLQDFSKALIIAINANADAIIVASNLHLSSITRKHLEDFSENTGLQVYYLPPAHISLWLSGHPGSINPKSDGPLLTLLQKSAHCQNSIQEFMRISKNDSKEPALPELIGVKRKQKLKELGKLFKDRNGILLLEGAAGAGKTFFTNHLCIELKKEHMLVYQINMENFRTPRVLFINILQYLWNIPLNLFITMDAKQLEEAIQTVDETVLAAEEKETVLSALSRDIDTYNANSEVYNYYLVKYLLKIYRIRKRHSHILFHFANLNAISSQMMDFLLSFVNDFSVESGVILEIRTSEYIDANMSEEMWEAYIEKFHGHSMLLCTYELEEFSREESYQFVCSRLVDVNPSISFVDKIIRFIGKNPLLLGSLIEYLKMLDFFTKTPRALWEQNLNHMVIDNRWQVIYLLIDIFCKKDAFYPAFFEVTKWFGGNVPRNCIRMVIREDADVKVDALIHANLFSAFPEDYRINHPVQMTVLNQRDYCIPSYKQELSKGVLEYLKTADLDADSEYILKFTLYQNLNDDPHVIEIGYQLTKSLYHAGQLLYSYRYAQKTLDYVKNYEETREYILLEIELLEYLVRLSLYLKEDTLERLPLYMKDLEETIIAHDRSLGKHTDFLQLKLEYYMDKNRYEHSYGKFAESFQTMEEAYLMTLENGTLPASIITNVWVEYAIALKENESLEKSLVFLEESRRIYPQAADLRFTYNTQKYESLIYVSTESALDYLNDNVKITPPMAPPEIYHNRIHLFNTYFYLHKYDILLADGIEDMMEISRMGLKNEEGRLAALLGNVYYVQENLEEAYKYYQYGVDIYQGNNYISNLWPILVNLSTLLIEKGEHLSAYQNMERVIDILNDSYLSRVQHAQSDQEVMDKFKAAVLLLYRNSLLLEKQPYEFPRNLRLFLEQHLMIAPLFSKLKELSASQIDELFIGSVFLQGYRPLLGY